LLGLLALELSVTPTKGNTMTLYQPEPVEISTRMRPGDWTEESLQELVAKYQADLQQMGASPEAVVTDISRNDDGSVSVIVSWNKAAVAETRPREEI
jgi:hypothetical protein